MLTEEKLWIEHKKKKSIINSRLKEFSKNMDKSDDELFPELCFCLCTPQSNAKRVADVVNKDNLKMLKHHKHEQLVKALRSNCRFHNNKAGYIVEARKFIPYLRSLNKDSMIAREFLVKNIKGLGYKEASHFLRNIGYRNICIVDRHVINLMHELKVFKDNTPPKSPKQYLSMEQSIKDYAKKIGIDVDELDLLLWSLKTGFVFK